MSATHAHATYPTAASLDAMSRHWPGTYPVPHADGQRAYRLDRDSMPPTLIASCTCGDWHGHPMHDASSVLVQAAAAVGITERGARGLIALAERQRRRVRP